MEDRYAEEALQTRGDRRQTEVSRCAGLTGLEHGGCYPPDRRQRGGLREELFNGEIFDTLRKAKIVTESWRRHYDAVRAHASLGYKPSALEIFVPMFSAWPATLAQPPALN